MSGGSVKKIEFTLDHIIMMAIADLESSYDMPEIFIDEAFQDYHVELTIHELKELMDDVVSRLMPYAEDLESRLDLIAIAEPGVPDKVDIGIRITPILVRTKKKGLNIRSH